MALEEWRLQGPLGSSGGAGKREGVLTRSQQTDMEDGERKLQRPAADSPTHTFCSSSAKNQQRFTSRRKACRNNLLIS